MLAYFNDRHYCVTAAAAADDDDDDDDDVIVYRGKLLHHARLHDR